MAWNLWEQNSINLAIAKTIFRKFSKKLKKFEIMLDFLHSGGYNHLCNAPHVTWTC